MTVREFHAHHRNDAGVATWFEDARLLSSILVIIQLLRLDLLGRSLPRTSKADEVNQLALNPGSSDGAENAAAPAPGGWTAGWADGDNEPLPDNDDELPLSVILDENGSAGSILAGRENGAAPNPSRSTRMS